MDFCPAADPARAEDVDAARAETSSNRVAKLR